VQGAGVGAQGVGVGVGLVEGVLGVMGWAQAAAGEARRGMAGSMKGQRVLVGALLGRCQRGQATLDEALRRVQRCSSGAAGLEYSGGVGWLAGMPCKLAWFDQGLCPVRSRLYGQCKVYLL
jgi:hypothetical protein